MIGASPSAELMMEAVVVSEWEEEGAAGLALLVCNAGVGYARETAPRVTANGFEEKIGVNHLGHFLLTNLLLAPPK